MVKFRFFLLLSNGVNLLGSFVPVIIAIYINPTSSLDREMTALDARGRI